MLEHHNTGESEDRGKTLEEIGRSIRDRVNL